MKIAMVAAALEAQTSNGQLRYNESKMSRLEASMAVPLTEWEDGSIRITGSRVPIDTVVHNFKLGATAEEILYRFPSLGLADIYGAIYYYLTHREQIEHYLQQQEAEADAVQARIESDPEYQKWKTEIRERLLARHAERDRTIKPPAAY